ncbi:DUF3152 domain-containing protein [Streptomyces sp. 184]|uniref:DUF3152 domain-containing protein n=1 Tax=Streptomyces sp. 184 TaxID=1827526 RepID=UPI0038924C9D
MPRVTDTGSMRPVGDTGAMPRVGDTGGFRGVGDTGAMRRTAAPGGPPHAAGMPRAPRTPGMPGMPGRPGTDDTGEHPLGHPEHREPGGGWGAPPYEQPAHGLGTATVAAAPSPVRQEYLDAFDGPGPGPGHAAGPAARRRPGDVPGPAPAADDRGWPPPGDDEPPDDSAALESAGGGRRRARRRPTNRARVATGVAAAVVTCALAAAIAGQVSDGRAKRADAAASDARKQRAAADDAASRSGGRDAPAEAEEEARAVPATYGEKMAATYPLSRDLTGSGKLTAVPGGDKAPGRGDVVAYRVDVEEGLPLDGELFASAVHKTLNDKRSWGGQGYRTFERVGPGEESEFVITLASPGTTDEWCAKSGLDTGDEDVSCDSAATERVMINAFRWAQGSKTYGDDIHGYRQMLINHEVGHRLGNGHVGCAADGALAPVMMQQTKYLSTDGATCKPNPWPFPRD